MKEKLKVYHGLPKTPITDATVLYSSLDGKTTPEIGSSSNVTKEFIPVPSVTGYAMRCKSHVNVAVKHLYTQKDINSNSYTIEYWMDMTNFNQSDLQASGSNFEQYGIYFANCSKSYDELRIMGIIFKPSQNKYYNWIRIYEGTTYEVQIPIELRLNHFRITRNNDTVKIYHNGKEYYSGTHSLSPIQGNYKIKFHDITVPICDLVVHDRDLGDYFPTLPQDYIDGKAIVVPALNQRQSYGDPVLHQVTELLVPAQSETELGKYYSTNVRDADGYEQCLESPELYAGNWHNWAENYGKIRILGIDNTYITGVIDTDTAKCRVTSAIVTSVTTGTFTVDDTSKLVAGDRLWIYSSTMNNTWDLNETNYLQITSINHTTKEITATTNRSTGFKVTIGDILIETTASTSSPVVKTVDETVVNGTWSGLGTNVATFTLGSNSNIAGKDLVVTYCLNARGNASPYPKMPSEVIRGYNELGHELIPANGIVIQDDFKGKISGSILECPHTLKYALESSLRLPNNHWNEFTQSHYNTVASIASPVQGHIAQILVEVDLVRFVENKMGVEIPGNKLNWLNNNIKNITCRALVRGNNDTNNNCYIKYMGKGNSWSLNSSGATSNSSSAKLIVASWSPTGLLSSTKSYFLIHSDALSVAGNDNLKSRVVLSDVQLELTFNIDERYDYLYTKDLASRCDGYANPILVDKQTKEVKRLLPSTAPFSTEVLTYNSGNITSLSNCTLITQSNTHMLTTMGTGSSDPFVENQYRGLLGKLDLAYFNSADYLGEPAYRLPLGANTSRFSLGCKFVLSQPYMENMNFFQVSEVFPNVNQLAIKHGIVKKDTELYLRLLVLGIKANSLDYTSNIQYYKLPNRPLIK